MFTKLTERLSQAANALRGRGRLTEDTIAELRDVRIRCSKPTSRLPW